MDVAAPTLDDTPNDDTAAVDDLAAIDDDTPAVEEPAPPRRSRRRRRRILNRLALPAGALELGIFAAVAFVLWWATRSWLLTALLAVAWLLLVGAARAWHRRRRASIDQRRVGRERLTTYTTWAFIILGCLAGIRAWSTRTQPVPKPDPPNAYLSVAGVVTSAWPDLYGQPVTIRAVTQTAPAYWVAVAEDDNGGCWTQAVVLRNPPFLAGERAPAPCPPPLYAPTQRGDKIDPAKSPGAQAALDFTAAWLADKNWPIYTAPGSNIRPLGRTIKVTGLTVYPIASNGKAATVQVVGQADDGPLGLIVRLVDDQGRWFVTAVSGSPPVDGGDTIPLPATSSTSSTSTTTTSTSR